MDFEFNFVYNVVCAQRSLIDAILNIVFSWMEFLFLQYRVSTAEVPHSKNTI